MRQYEKNIDVLMPIRNFGETNGKAITHCKLKHICSFDGMNYYIDLFSADGELLGGRWITRHMYRYHVLGKAY